LDNPPLPTSTHPLSLHDALPISAGASAVHAEVEPGHRLTGSDVGVFAPGDARDIRCGESQVKHAAIKQRNVLHLTRGDRLRLRADRKSTRLNSSHQIISYAVFCL